MSYQLTAGILERLHGSQEIDDALLNSTPTVQFLSFKKVPGPSDRYRVIMSDGEHFLQAMLATQLNHLIDEDKITKHTVAVIEKFTCNIVSGKRLTIILGIRVIAKDAEKIGNPTAFAQPDKETSADPISSNPSAVSVPAPSSSTSTSTTVTSTTTVQGGSSGQAPRQQITSNKGPRSTIYPIESLSPYQNHWTIKARVTHKSDIKTWVNNRGEGKLFNVNLIDDSGEIKATAFNAAVDELFDKLQEGKVYLISKARVNLAKRQFSTVQNEYELVFEHNTQIEECHDATDIPALRFNFVGLADLLDRPKDSNVDVLGIVKEAGEVGEIVTKTGNKLSKRELTLVDRSQYSVRLTLWGKNAEQWAVEESEPVIAFKGVRVGDFGGRSLSMQGSSTMIVNPDIPEAHALRGWYDAAGNQQSYQSFTGSGSSAGPVGGFNRAEALPLEEIKVREYGMEDKPQNFSVRGTVLHVKPENLAYPACITQGCNKKVIEGPNGWRCEKCDKVHPKPEYRYIIQMAVSDFSGQLWLQGFNEIGQTLFGISADELIEMKDRDEQAFTAFVERSMGTTYNFWCRAKQDTYNEQTRIRYAISRMSPLNYTEECQHMIETLKSPWGTS